MSHDRPLLLLLAHLLVIQATDTSTLGGEWQAEKRPLLVPWWRAVEDGDRLLFEYAGEVVELNGRAVRVLLPTLVPLLDGAHTVAEIVDVLGHAAEAPILKALALLDAHGLLADGPPARGENDAAACYVAAVCWTTPAAASAALARSHVVVLGSAPAATEVARLLTSAGVATTSADLADGGAESDLVVAAPAPDEVERLMTLNELRLDDAMPWLVLLPPDGRIATVGPLYIPGQSACHACYLLRRGATSGYEADFPLVDGRPVRAPMPPPTATITAGLAALVCLRWLGAHDPTLPGVLYGFELQGALGLTRHRVLRVPRCPACGVSAPPPSPWFREPDAGAR